MFLNYLRGQSWQRWRCESQSSWRRRGRCGDCANSWSTSSRRSLRRRKRNSGWVWVCDWVVHWLLPAAWHTSLPAAGSNYSGLCLGIGLPSNRSAYLFDLSYTVIVLFRHRDHIFWEFTSLVFTPLDFSTKQWNESMKHMHRYFKYK